MCKTLTVPIFMAMLWLSGLSLPANGQQLNIHLEAETQTLTADDLLELGNAQMVTDTPWTDEAQHFEGIYLADLLASLEAEASMIEAMALNGYSVDIPVQAALDAQAFIAVKANGELMRVRDKGPFWIVFPWSEQSELETRTVRSWAIWQLTDLKLVD